ncbi:SOUL family heme-binding protein [Arenicella xantha]|uniref:SOUL heme-binding protein n=1 Tax=Arenicella xantha TaxID=644221 RepID=A0A395JIL5_9GAMM|nr:heme-binding protein [Arenicella xantha]RBP49906.1 SOUL heme-binding protein [Arenicella xantha]
MRGLIFVVVLTFCLPLSVLAVDEPPHTVVLKDHKFELRQYRAMLIAEVTVTGDMRRAGNSGFKPLADYIFGNNTSAEKMQMTAPVTRTESTKIAMTAPVTRVENDDKSWTVAFVMPVKWTKETLPQPNNPDISIREVPAELIASIRFSGRGSEVSHKKKQLELEQWIDQQGYVVAGEPRYAGYDAPWVLWPLRRNEVMIPVVSENL